MFTRLFGALGLSTADDIIGFLICGMAVLPTMLFIGGERNAAAVIVLLFINVLVIFGLRNRERENLREAERSLRGKREDENDTLH